MSALEKVSFEELYMQIQRRLSVEFRERLDKLVPGSQALILGELISGGPQNISALADGLGITKGGVTGLSDKLVAGGLARRKRHEADRRVVFLEVTDEGRAVMRLYRQEIQSSVKYIFACLSDDDMEHLIRIYQQVLNRLDGREEEEKAW